MSKIKTYTTLFATTIIFIIMSALICFFPPSVTVLGSSALSKSIFKATDCQIASNKVASAEGSVFSDKRAGVYVRATNPNANVKLNSEVCGVFDMDFKVFSNQKGRNDLQSVGILFEDANSSNTLEIRMTMDKQWNFASTTVRINGSSEGYGNCLLGGNVYGIGTIGLYTEASFCNIQQDNIDMPQKIRFDPKTMSLYAMTQGSMIRILSMTDITNARATDYGKLMPSFEKYKVSILLDDLVSAGNEERPGQMIIYSINGQNLDGVYLTNSDGARLFANLENFGAVNEPYTLPSAYAYDVIDGLIPFTGVKSVALNKVPVSVTNNKFTPKAQGSYSVSYKGTTDSSGMTANAFITNADIKAEKTPFEWDMSFIQGDITIGKGEDMLLPSAKVTSFNRYHQLSNEVTPSSIVGRSENANVSAVIKKGSDIVKPAFDASKESNFVFDVNGDYTLTYTATDNALVSESKVINIKVSDIPVFEFKNFKSILPNPSTLELSALTAKFGANSLRVETKLYTPDDKVIALKTIPLNLSGSYRLEASAVSGGRTFKREYNFRALAQANNLFESSATMIPNSKSAEYAQEYNGLKVEFNTNNTTLRYKNAINIGNNTKNDLLMEYMVMPTVSSVAEFNGILLKLIDSKNADNYINLQIVKAVGEEYEWLSNAKSSSGTNGFRGDAWGTLTSEAAKGTAMDTSFYGITKHRGGTCGSGRIYFDTAERAFYVAYASTICKVLDLDDPQDVMSGNEWGGFSSDEVYLELTMLGLDASCGNLMIMNINGSSLSGEWLAGQSEPSISINYAGNASDNLPIGVVNTKYRLFDAVAMDQIDGNLPIIKRVTFNGENVAIDSDGTFTPDSVGEYIISYAVRDSRENLTITVASTPTEMDYEFTQPPKTSALVGQEIFLPNGVAVGGSGHISVETQILKDDKILEKNALYYVFTSAGEYTYRIVLTDYLQATKNIDTNILVTASPKPVVTKMPSVLRAIINGKEFIIPMFDAKIFARDGSVTDAIKEVYIMNGSEKIALTMGQKWTPNFTVTTNLTLHFEAFNSDKTLKTELEPYELTVIANPTKADYFYNSADAYEKTASSKSIDFVTQQSDEMLYFANKLFDNVGIELNCILGKQKFKRINFFITDSVNPDIAVKLSLVNSNNITYLYINDEKTARLDFKFSDEFFTKFDIIDNFVTENLKKVAKIETCINGKPFNGFESMLVNFAISLSNVTGESGISITNLNDQTINNLNNDYKSPNVRLFGSYVLEANIGETITVYKGMAQDVLSQVTKFTVTVTSPTGKKVLDAVSAYEQHTFKIDEYGIYKISYKAVDSNGNSDPRITSISVFDNIAPIITLKGEKPQTGKVDSVVTLPSMIVTDNNGSAGLSAYVYVIDSDGKIEYLNKDVYEFTPKLKGKYRVVYYAFDKDYSAAIESFFVTIK